MILPAGVPDLMHFARGGGGGSGSGGSGGGGGGIFFILGYVPTHFWGALLRKKFYNPIGRALAIGGAIIYGFAWWRLGSFGFFVGLCAFLGGPAGYFGWFGKISQAVRQRANQEIAVAASKDPAWNGAVLQQRVTQVFMAFQQDWSTFDIQNMRTYLAPTYAQHMELVLLALRQRQRRNAVEAPQIVESYPTDVVDSDDNTQDRVTFYVHGKADDRLLETVNGQEQQLFIDKSDFYEYWRFVRSDTTWLLESIDQLTVAAAMLRPTIRTFATQNGLFYSADWGWLLLPRRGQLFGGAKFGTSDINNHVIGVYKNVLVELYTYVPRPNAKDTNESQYLIAQAALPKRYDSLIVEAKSSGLGSFLQRTPGGYNKISLEWPDFNKRYNVYATNAEQVTAFELLHPVYMEKLFALPFKVSIEVVDNVVYLYSKDKNADYPTMYAILKDAFDEMRL